MKLSDISVTRPVFASVLSLLLVAFGILSYQRLPLREYPDIDAPIVSVETTYPGAAARVVETRITEVIEEVIAGVEGIRFIESSSTDGESNISIEFEVDRDIDAAANDIRDRVSGVRDDLPLEADPPDIRRVDSNEDVIVWFNLTGEGMSVPELTDYAERYLVDRFSVIRGVARVRVGGGQTYAMRIWLDRQALAARNITVSDVEAALRQENVELPAGQIESATRQFTVRVERAFLTPEDFGKIVLARGDDGYLLRLGDVARVEKGTNEDRTFFRGNTVPQVGVGIIKQSTANTIAVARAAQAEREKIDADLPQGMQLEQSYDTSVFIEQAIHGVYITLGIAIVLVVLVIYLFLGNVRATLVPAVTVPVSIIASSIVLYVMDFSVNLLTLLALVLAIGMVVDDAIVVLENIFRRMQEEKESPLIAAIKGTRQVGFAVIATTLVLLSVFIPITFLQGDLGRLFSEFALTISAAVAFSSFVALSLSPMLASKVLQVNESPSRIARGVESGFARLRVQYSRLLSWSLGHSVIIVAVFVVLLASTVLLFRVLPTEYAPKEDRGAFFVLVNGPEGASYSYMEDYMDEIEARLMKYVENDEITRLLVRTPRGFGNIESFNSGIVICVLNEWGSRRSGFVIMDEIRKDLSDLAGVRAFPVMRQGFGQSIQKPFRLVLGGGTYEQLAQWRDTLVAKMKENNPGLEGIDWDYKETKPQLEVAVNYNRAAELGVSVRAIGSTLETMLGSRRVTTYIEEGEEYDVILEGERDSQRNIRALKNIYVRSERSGALIPLGNLVSVREEADSGSLNRYNRVRAVTVEANLADSLSLGDALEFAEDLVRTHLPPEVIIDYKGESQDFKSSSQSIVFVFVLGLIVTFLVLAAQFESYVHPLVIMLTVPLAGVGALAGLWLTGSSLNIYSQIGLLMLVGLSAKNGILIVEFANQLRDQGVAFSEALVQASTIRFRPILMTGITTAAGSIPLIVSSGAGSETRFMIGITILCGILSATLLTLLVVPIAYQLLAKGTGSPGAVRSKALAEEPDLGI